VRQEEGRLVVGACGVPPPALMLAQHRNCSCAMSMLCFARTLDCSLAHALAFLTAMCDRKKYPRHPPPSLHVTGLPVQRRGAVGKGKWDRASRARAWGDLILPGSMRAGPASCVLGQCPCSALFPCVPSICFHKVSWALALQTRIPRLQRAHDCVVLSLDPLGQQGHDAALVVGCTQHGALVG
jgi:hypothetical protein